MTDRDSMPCERSRAGQIGSGGTDSAAKCTERDSTTYDAAPAARASVESVAPQPTTRGDSDRADKAAPRPSEGTGDTLVAESATTAEPAAWATFYPNGSTASVYVGRKPPHAEPLYRHPPVTNPLPKEKRAEVSDRSKPITGPDPDSRVWETHTPATHATRGEGSEQRECTEPVAWATFHGTAHCVAEPLYRRPQPTLTDAEREALHWFSHYGLPEPKAAALRGLLERLGGAT